MTAAPIYWIKKVEETLQESKIIPLWGMPPAFPWKECAQVIAQSLNLPSCTIKAGDSRWLEAKEILIGLGQNPISVALELTPLFGDLHLVFSSEDVVKLISHQLGAEVPYRNFSDKGLQEGYFQFLILGAAAAMNDLKPYEGLSLKVGAGVLPSEDKAFCLDVMVQIGKESMMGRLISSSSFLHSFREHFGKSGSTLFESNLRHEIELDLHFEVGTTSLSLTELQNVAQGDFIALDRCFYDPKKRSGKTRVMLGRTPLFEALVLDGKIEIADYSFYHEEQPTMEPISDDEGPIEENPEEVEETSEEEHLWSTPIEAGHSVKDILSTKNIPVVLTVEVGQMNMSLDRVLELKPGNILDLAVHIDQPLQVKMHGKKIAEAELVKIGDLLGIKILQIGN